MVGLSDYEQKRAARIKCNEQKIKSLDLPNISKESPLKPLKVKATIKKKKDPTPATRISGRSKKAVNYKEKTEADVESAEENEETVTKSCGSTDVKRYRDLLIKHKKNLYKDPPQLPPDANVLTKTAPPPTRNGIGEYIFKDSATFRPNLSPMEVLQQGGFGGTYFRSIDSAVTGLRYQGTEVLGELPKEWIKGLSVSKQLCCQDYDTKVNKYGVKCGGCLGMWESSGWIVSIDPYGWFQWYCRYFQGRRSTDDERQISRWAKSAGITGRFRGQLCNKVLYANTSVDDRSISPVIRQTLHHWGFVLTQEALNQHKKNKGIK